MASRTPNYNLYVPGQGDEGWDAEVNQSIATIDSALKGLGNAMAGAISAVFRVSGMTWATANALWTGSVWNREDTGKGAIGLRFDPAGKSLTVYYANAGANPITWTVLATLSTGAFDLGGKRITTLGAPSAATDAATKGYVDSAAIPKLSQLVMDADKNCNGRNFTNMGLISPKRTLSPSDMILIAKGPNGTATFGSQLVGTGYVKVVVYSPGQSGNYDSWSCEVQLNGVRVGGASQGAHDGGTWTIAESLAVKTGDTLKYIVTAGTQFGEMRVCGIPGLTAYDLIT